MDVTPHRDAALLFCKNWWPYPATCLTAVRFGGSSCFDTDHMTFVPSKYKRIFEDFKGVEIDGKEVLFDDYVAYENGNVDKCCDLIQKAAALREGRVFVDDHVTFLFS